MKAPFASLQHPPVVALRLPLANGLDPSGIPVRVAAGAGRRATGDSPQAIGVYDSGTIEPVLNPSGQSVRIIARNPSAQRIRGPVSNYEGDQYLSVTYDGNRSWNNSAILATRNCEKYDLLLS